MKRPRWVSDQLAALLALAPAALIVSVAFYGFLAWTIVVSVTSSGLLPRYEWLGVANYALIFSDPRFLDSFCHLAVFGGVLILAGTIVGLCLAIALDWLRRRGRRTWILESIILYPVAVSWLVTGIVWQWILDPHLGLERTVRELGFPHFTFDALVRPGAAVFALAGAATWHMAGMAMAVFSAGLRGVDPELWHAARLERVPPHRVYCHVIMPMLGPHLLTVVLLLNFGVIRAFDLVVAMTGGGPGYATDMPSLYVYDHMFARGHLAVGAAAAVVLAVAMGTAIAPYLILTLRRRLPV